MRPASKTSANDINAQPHQHINKHSGSRILFKTEVAQAVISADKAVLIKGRRERDAAHLATEIIKVMI